MRSCWAGARTTGITKTIHDGTYDVPYRELLPVAVTKENMDDVIIKGGSTPRRMFI
ncbi:hypothetical protein [Enterocloster sp.]|uniref:hypothetical protein n=1 Tax=Enterocloster sp. TaxID=2719315 RepID=UPI0039A3CDD2